MVMFIDRFNNLVVYHNEGGSTAHVLLGADPADLGRPGGTVHVEPIRSHDQDTLVTYG